MKLQKTLPTSAPRVVVVGSLNLDLIAQVERLPAAGETVAGTALLRRLGGKGANQAVAAARQGASVVMVGCVGCDADGEAYVKRLAHDERIDARAIHRVRNETTGTALIAVDGRGQNSIVVMAGANARLTPPMIRAHADLIRGAKAMLVQLEVPLPAVLAAMRIANATGVPVVFNPSPLRPDFPWGRVALHTVVVNEIEARQIFGHNPDDLPRNVAVWRTRLAKRSIGQLLVTRGAESTLCLTAETFFSVPTLSVRPVDTVGAGDTFAGTLTARLAEGSSLGEAVALANVAGGLATLEPGAQEAMPSRRETERWRDRLR